MYQFKLWQRSDNFRNFRNTRIFDSFLTSSHILNEILVTDRQTGGDAAASNEHFCPSLSFFIFEESASVQEDLDQPQSSILCSFAFFSLCRFMMYGTVSKITHTKIFDMELTLFIVVLFCFIPLVFFLLSIYCIGVLAKQGQHNSFCCSTSIPALKKAELDNCVAAGWINMKEILFTNLLPNQVY